MVSSIAARIKMARHPVAVLRSSVRPENALQLKEGVWACAIGLLNAASKGDTAVFSEATTACNGGRVGLGFCKFQLGFIEHFLSTGQEGGRPGERYKETPELAAEYVTNMPSVEPKEYLVLKPLEQLQPEEQPDHIVFLVNADQLSALVTLANFDLPGRGHVELRFGAACAQTLLFPMANSEQAPDICTIGLTDPSGRKYIEKDLLAFSIPYHRYLAMEEKAENSFLTTDTWAQIAKRISE